MTESKELVVSVICNVDQSVKAKRIAIEASVSYPGFQSRIREAFGLSELLGHALALTYTLVNQESIPISVERDSELAQFVRDVHSKQAMPVLQLAVTTGAGARGAAAGAGDLKEGRSGSPLTTPRIGSPFDLLTGSGSGAGSGPLSGTTPRLMNRSLKSLASYDSGGSSGSGGGGAAGGGPGSARGSLNAGSQPGGSLIVLSSARLGGSGGSGGGGSGRSSPRESLESSLQLHFGGSADGHGTDSNPGSRRGSGSVPAGAGGSGSGSSGRQLAPSQRERIKMQKPSIDGGVYAAASSAAPVGVSPRTVSGAGSSSSGSASTGAGAVPQAASPQGSGAAPAALSPASAAAGAAGAGVAASGVRPGSATSARPASRPGSAGASASSGAGSVPADSDRLSRAAAAAAALQQLRSISESSGVGELKTVLHALSAHAESPSVQAVALHALGDLAVHNASAVAKAGGVDSALAAMQRHTRHVSVLCEACGALSNITYRNPANKALLCSKGGVDVILAAMRAHPTVAVVQDLACGALSNTADSFSAEQKAQFVGHEGLPLALKAMKDHPSEAYLQLNALSLLYNLCNGHEGSKAAVVEADGLELVLAAMAAHEGDLPVQGCGCGLLALLFTDNGTGGGGVLGLLASTGDAALTAVQLALSTHAKDARVQDAGKKAVSAIKGVQKLAKSRSATTSAKGGFFTKLL